MPEFRKDPIIGRWVIVASERAKRPTDFVRQPKAARTGMCPFCPGNEDKTPKEVMAYRDSSKSPNSKGWWLRVVPNKFPALRVEDELTRSGDGMYDLMQGTGAHEVIIESPDHEGSFATYDQRQVEEILWAYRDRMLELKKDQRLQYMLLFKNHGREAGASLDHPHSQLIAMPIVPKRVKEEMDGAEMYYTFKERCVFCDIIRQDLVSGDRVVEENDEFVACTPFASRFPFEMWILPKRHQTQFDRIHKHQVVLLAQLMRVVLGKVRRILDDPPYNFMLHTAPVTEGELPHYHWHIEVIPKLTQVAGFEWGTGFYINPTPPEEAAYFLREETTELEAKDLSQSNVVTLSA
ncbi:MAG: galactose-1-phosphate uridylyltransferase [bacterium]